MTKQIKFNLYGRQAEILNDWLTTDKNSMDIIHAGAGKSHLAAIALPIFASDPKYHKGKDVVFITGTTDMIKTNIWNTLKDTCINVYGVSPKDINNQDYIIKIGTTHIRCKSAEIRDRIRGMNAGIILCDEASLFSQEVLQELSNRLRPRVGSTDTPGRMIIISTPKGNGPLYDMYQMALANPDQWIVRHYNYLQMRSGNLEFIENQKRILSPMKFASDYLVSFDSVEDQFYYAWDKNKYSKPIVDDNRPELYSFHDFNKKRMAAIVARVNNPYSDKGTMEILKSYAIADCSTEGIAQAIRNDFPKRRINSIIDMSGTQVNRDTTSAFGITDRTLLEKYGFTIINTTKGNPLITDTDNSANAFISQGRLTVDPGDHLLQEALSSYHYEDGTRKKLVKYSEAKFMHIDGLGDALRYGIHTLFQIQHSDMSTKAHYRGNKLPSVGIEHMPASPLFPGGPTIEELLQGDTDDVYRGWN